jgi:hypothetical protein
MSKRILVIDDEIDFTHMRGWRPTPKRRTSR